MLSGNFEAVNRAKTVNTMAKEREKKALGAKTLRQKSCKAQTKRDIKTSKGGKISKTKITMFTNGMCRLFIDSVPVRLTLMVVVVIILSVVLF